MPQVREPIDLSEDQDAAAQIADARRQGSDESKIREALKFEVSSQRCPKTS